MDTIQGKIIRNGQEWHLSIKDSNGNLASISISAISENRGPIVKKVLAQWAIDNTTQTNEPNTPPTDTSEAQADCWYCMNGDELQGIDVCRKCGRTAITPKADKEGEG